MGILLLFLLVPTLVVGWIAYSYSVERIRADKIRVVGRIAGARHEQLAMVFQRAIARSHAFLGDLLHRCGTNHPDPGCVEPVLRSFLNSEQALGAMLREPDGRGVTAGEFAFPAERMREFQPRQLAQFSEASGGRERYYFIFVQDPTSRIRLEITYPVRIVQSIFDPQTDLGDSGETFLTDGNGYFITRARYPAKQGHSHPISATPMRRCLNGEDGETLDLDYRDMQIIHGFRFIPEIGSGCIMAHVDQAEAFAPLAALKQTVAAATLAFGLLAFLAATLFSHWIVRPVTRLTHVVRSIRDGNMTVRARPEGYSEIALLASSFNAMADRLASTNAELEKRVQERTQSLNLMAKVFTNSGESIVITDRDNRIVAVNDSFTKLTGYREEEVLGQNPKMLSAKRTPPETYELMWEAVTKHGYWEGELWDRRKSGEAYPKWLSISVVRDEEGRIVNFIGSFSDISERKASEERVLYLAHHDALTRLPNRLYLQEALGRAINFAKRNGSRLALLLIDLDRFKSINDTLGHHVGDLLLMQVGDRLTQAVRETDIVARLGGDEFVVVLPGIDTADDAALVARKLVDTLSAPYPVEQQELLTSPSIGICLYPDDAQTVGDLMKNGDVAMYHAKAKGRGNYQFFTEYLNRMLQERHSIEMDLRSALADDQFVLHYQPQLDLRTGQVVGMEALIRWRHPTRGLLPPAEFIPVAEEAGLVIPLGKWVIQEACRQLQWWRERGIPPMVMSVNLSASQFQDQGLPDLIIGTLKETGLSPRHLCLEVTESMAMASPGNATAMLEKLAGAGLALAIDDFGTGYCSLTYLKLFPIHTLKIDRTFVRDLETEAGDTTICDVAVLLAHKLGLDVVAEGVETEAQLRYLHGIGCEKVQGYVVSKPLPADEAERFLRSHSPLAQLRTMDV